MSPPPSSAPLVRELVLDGPLDLRQTLRHTGATYGDPTLRLRANAAVRARWTPEGPATLEMEIARGRLRARAWGEGAEWCLERLADLSGLSDEPPRLDDLPRDLHAFARCAPGLRLPRTHAIVEALAHIVLQQKVSGAESGRAWRGLMREWSQPAPGPWAGHGLRLPLDAHELATLPSASMPPLGVLGWQAERLRRVGELGARLEALAAGTPQEAETTLCKVAGFGVWSARTLRLRALGDPDAVPEGDWNLPNVIAFNLTGGKEGRADDARMLELLEPYRGQRGRAIAWITTAGHRAPRRGPRMPLRTLH